MNLEFSPISLRLAIPFALEDSNREFACDPYVALEVLPKAVYFKRLAEEEF